MRAVAGPSPGLLAWRSAPSRTSADTAPACPQAAASSTASFFALGLAPSAASRSIAAASPVLFKSDRGR